MIVDAEGRDAGLRFVDIDRDGYDDVIFSNAERYSLHLFVPAPKPHLGWYYGWSQIVRAGKRGDANAIPMIVRGGEHNHNGAWFHSGQMWIQNEETADLPDRVDRRSYAQLLAFDSPAPVEPEEAIATFEVLPGFKIEMVAHEPLVKDPIAFEWGPDGKLWVVEMGDYPVGVDGRGKAGGVVRVLEDRNGDGFYETSTVFLDGLNFPTGVMPWRKGILISAAPDIIYAEDTTGDGKADVRKVLFTGFREGNQQHRVNGFEYGIDNWVYAANGDSGGVIRSIQTGRSVNISGRDFRFNPDTGEFETQAGQTQFGRRRDDWGNWFGNNNPNWGWHYWLPEHYLPRNPHLAVRSSRQMLGNYPNATRIFPISKPMQRFNWPDLGNTLTSANSPTPYRDELFGAEFETSLFVSEPEYNLVHREVLTKQGVTFTSRRAEGEPDREFLASRDNWFRPCMIKTGPDGALYIADMYRLVIEHIEYGFPEMAERIDLRAGADRGRIYRVYPENASLRPFPRLDRMTTPELAAALETPNGWQRDTVQRLLVHAQDQAAVAPLKDLFQRSGSAKTRLHALGALDGLGAVSPGLIVTAMRDPHPAVREHAIRLSEPFLKQSGSAQELAALHDVLLQLVHDADERVRFQLAFTLGEWSDPRAGVALARLAGRDFKNPHLQTAIMSSAPAHLQRMLTVAMTGFSQERGPMELLQALLALAADMGDHASLAEGLSRLGERAGTEFADWQFSVVAGVLDALDRRNSNLAKLQSSARPELREALAKLDPMFRQARDNVDTFLKAPSSEGSARVSAAIRILGRGASETKEDIERMGRLLRPQVPGEVQEAALGALPRLRGGSVGEVLVAGWRSYPPAMRSRVLSALLSRQDWMTQLLGAVAGGEIQRGQIPAADQQTLLNHSQPAIRDQARQLFAAAAKDRQKIVQQYERVGSLKGNAAAGAALFGEHCASCHRLKGHGVAVGPDLAMMSDKSVQAFVIGTFDPNQSIDPPFISYTALTTDERELSGIITSETPTSITLKMADGREEVLLRRDLKDLASSGLSLMPEGFEAAITPQGMADVIAYILGQ
jgi:putative membrane-bound dehydrogenase-like protein